MFKRLITLKKLTPLQSIKQLKKSPSRRLEKHLSDMDMILYSSNICYHAKRLIDDDVRVTHKDAKLKMLLNEIKNATTMIESGETYTKREVTEFMKDAGIRNEHLK